jgi:phospholipase C
MELRRVETQNRIEHIVVLMLENRSFDNVLGWACTRPTCAIGRSR